MRRLENRELAPVLVLTALAAIAYAAVALLRHAHWWSGFDLGLFGQAVWNYGNLDAPVATAKGGLNLLGDHFHPIVALLAPLGWTGATVELLLVAQALLVAASIVPVYLFARERLELIPAYAITVAYAGFWGIVSGVGFEFHEVAFAPLLIALGILWGERRQWGRFAAAMLLLACVKEDMTLLVAFFGIWLLSRREWRAGAATFAGGVFAYWFATKVAIPHFADGRAFAYWTYDPVGDDLPDALGNMATEPWLPFEVGLDAPQKRETVLLLLAPFLALSLCSRIGLLLIPLLAERVLSTNEGLWGTAYHYSLPLAPVLAMGAAAGLANLLERRPRVALPAAAAFVVLALVTNVAAHTGAVLKEFAKQQPFAETAAWAVDQVPDNASVASQDFVFPRLAERRTADLIRPGMAAVDYIVAGPFETAGTVTGNSGFAEFGAVLRAQLPAFVTVGYREGWLVLRRRRPREGGRGVLGRAHCGDLETRARSADHMQTVAALCGA